MTGRWRALRDDEELRPGTLPFEIDGRRMVFDDADDDANEDVDISGVTTSGNGADTAAALREVAARLVGLPKLERELQQKIERKRLGASVAEMKAALREALEAEAEAAALQAAREALQADGEQPADPGFNTTDEPAETDDEVIARLAKLAPLEFAREREAAAKLLGIRVSRALTAWSARPAYRAATSLSRASYRVAPW